MAKQVEDIVVRLVGEGFEALDKIKGSFRELGKVTNLAEKDILSARDSLLDFAKKAGNTEAVNKGLTEAFKGLRSQVDLSSEAYRSLSGELRRLDEESKGATRSIMAQRNAVLASTTAGTQNVAALQQQRAALIALRAQTRDASTAFDQFSADIEKVETRLTDLANVNNRLNSALSRARAGTAAGARAELEDIEKGIALRRQEINDIDLLNKKQRNTPEILRQRLELENQLNASLAARRQIQFQETARTGREGARTGAATFNSADLTGTGYLTAERISGRLGDLPNTTAGLSQELGELNERLINTYRNTETYIAVQLRLAAVQRDVTSATQGFGAALLADLNAGTLIPSQKNLAEVIGALRREMLELDQTTTEGSRAYAQNATQVRLLERQLQQLANAYTNVADKARTTAAQGTNPFTASGARNPAYAQEQLAELNAALNTADESSLASVDALLNAKRSLYEYEAQVNAQLDQQKDQLAAQDLARVDAQDKKEAAALQRELDRLDILKQQTAAAREALGFNTHQQLSPLYQQITGLATAGVARQQQFMGRSPSQVLDDIASSFNAGGRGVDLKQRSTEIGGSVAEGVAQGATDSAATAAGAKSFADKLITAYKQAFRIKSPSGESEEKIGVPIGQGIGLGIIKGIEGLKARIQLAIKGVTATPGRAGLPASVGPVSDVADSLQSFLARSSAKTSAFLPLTRLMGEGVTGSAALPLAAYRRSYERGGIVSPSFLPVEERRGLRGTPGIPGAGLEEIIRAEAFKAVSRTGAFVGPLSGPKAAGGAIASAYRAGISPGTFQRPAASGASLPLFGAAAQPAPLQRTMPGKGYQMGGSQFAFPTDGQLGAGRTQSFGRGAANASITEAISTYRKTVDNFWNGETGYFETIRRVVSSRAQLSASKLARNLSETRNTTAALSTAAVQLVSVPGAAFTKLRAGVSQELSEIKATLGEVVQKDLNSVRSGGQKLRQSVSGIGGAVRNAVSPLLGGRYGYLDREMEQFEQGFMRPRVTGGAAPPIPPVPPGGGGGGPSPAANNEFTKLNTTLTQFGSLSRRSVTDIRQLGSVLDELRADLSPVDAEYRQVNKSIEAQQVLIERELGRRVRRQRRAPSTGQLVQAGGAAISGGIFGGPEGFLGGVGGAVLGTALPGIGTAGGAFAGAAAGAQVGMFRQQLAGTADYAASIGKLQIALRGVVGSQAAYDAAIRAAAAATRDLNIPQEEATRGLTRLSAAVIGAGGTVADSSFAFRAMSEAIKATGGNAEQVDGALLALTQVFSKGKVSAEELNQIAERLPGTFTLFAQAAGKTGPELQKALEQGEVGLNDLMKFLDLTSKRYGTTALEIAGSSQDAGARLTVAFQAMRLEVGKALQPLGAELQGAFATFIKDITPAVVGSAKAIAAVLSFLTTNDLVAFGVQLTAVSLGFIGLQAAAAALTSLNIASWFTATAVGARVTSSGMAAATVTTGGLTGAIKALTLAMARNPLTLLILAGTAAAIKVGSVVLEQKKLNDEVQRSLDITAKAPASGVATEINATENALREARSKFAGGLQSFDFFGFGFIAAEANVARLETKLQKLKTTFKGRVEIETIFKGLGTVPTGYKVVNGRLAYLSPGQGYIDAETGKPVGAGRTNFPGGGGEDGGEKAGAALLQAIEQREEALLNLRTQREEQLAQIREQAVEQAKQIETQLADKRLAIERQIADITRQRSDFTEDSERRIRAASGESSDRIADEQRIADIFREERDSRIQSERTLADDKKQQEETIAEFQRGVAKSINDANRAHTKSMGEIQKQYANSVAKIIDEGTGKAGKRLEKAAQLAAQYIQRGTANSQIASITGGVIPARRQGVYDFGTVGGKGTATTDTILKTPGFEDVQGPLKTILKLDDTIESLQKGLNLSRAPVSPGSFDISSLATDFGQIASASFIGGLLAQNPSARRTPESQIFRDDQGRPLNGSQPTAYPIPVIPSAASTANLRNDQAQTEQEAARAKAAQQIKEAFAGVNAESAQFTNGLNEQLDLLGSQRKFLDMGFSDSLSRDLANLDKSLATSKVRLQDIATDLQNRGEDPATVDALQKAAIARAQELYNINVKLTQELEKQAQAMRTRQDNRIGLGMKEGALAYVESVGTMREATAQLTQNGIKGLEDQLFSLVTTGTANFREFAAEILKQSARMILQLTIQRVIMQIIGAIGGGSTNLGSSAANVAQYAPLPNATGNAFAKNNIIPYAMGGVVSKPTLFKFANGGTTRTGLMGEAGPEAIIPLKRGADGRLGVSGGGSAPVNVTVNVDASGDSKVAGDPGQGAQLGRLVAGAVQAELVKQKRPGGLLAA